MNLETYDPSEITPRGSYVLVTFEPYLERERASGILISDPKNEGLPYRGKVLRVGASPYNGIKEGDEVIFNDQNPVGVHFTNLKALLIDSEFVTAVVK